MNTPTINIPHVLSRLGEEILLLDKTIKGAIKGGLSINEFGKLIKSRASLSIQRKELMEQFMAESHFDSESTLCGMGHITVETIQ